MRHTVFLLCLALVACVSGERLYGRTLAAAEGTPVDASCSSPPVGPPGTNAAFNQLCTSGVSGRTVYVAGQRGRTCTNNTDATTCSLVPIGADLGKDRIRAAYRNMKIFAESQGASINDCLRIVCYVSNNGVYDAARFAQLRLFANQVQGEAEFWGAEQPKCARTIVGVDWLNENDIFEVEGTFWARK